MKKVPYTKVSLSPQEQVELLHSQDITFHNRMEAERFLTFHNYYYVSGYIYYFEKKGVARTHELSRPVSFSDIILLINFNQQLRELFFSAVQTIEIAVRSSIARELSMQHGPFCLEKEEIFRGRTRYGSFIDKLKQTLREHQKEPFIAHFSTTYLEPIPPVWVMIEVLTFGIISFLYSRLRTDLQKSIAADFGVDHTILISWLKALTELRNTCAHHSRLWNKVFVNHPKIRKEDKSFPFTLNGANRLGTFVPLITKLLDEIGEKYEWNKQCLRLLSSNHLIRPVDLGLSKWWRNL